MSRPVTHPASDPAPAFLAFLQNQEAPEVTRSMSEATGGAPATEQGAIGATPPAEPARTPDGSFVQFLWPIALMFGLMWLLVLRPERKKRKELDRLRSELKKGDRVLMAAGMLGNVVALSDDFVTVEIADRVRVQFQKAAVAQVLESKGREKAETAAAK